MTDISTPVHPGKSRARFLCSEAAGQGTPQEKRENEPAVLRPFIRDEAFTVKEAAERAGRSIRTIRRWCAQYYIGRPVPTSANELSVSRVALEMLLDGARAALDSYLQGDRDSPVVTSYYERCGVPLPRTLARRGAA